MIRWDARTPVGRLLRLPLRCIPANAVLPVLSGPLRGLRWTAGSAPHGAWLGLLERRKLEHFCQRLTPATVVWDIGANVGLYSLCAARRVREVVAFEPVEENLRHLRRHIDLNGLGNVTIVEKAVLDRCGAANMTPGDSASEWRMDGEGCRAVESISLDAWSPADGASPPIVMKVDVEGAETEVLNGALRILEEARPVIYLALHGEAQAEACGEVLDSLHYRVVSLEPGRAVTESSEWYAEPRG